MDWWGGMNACGTSSVADMNQIDASIFDPWINCDDLDLGNILHQASSAATTPSTHSSSPAVSAGAPQQQPAPQQAGSPAGAVGLDGMQNYAFLCGGSGSNHQQSNLHHQQLHSNQQHLSSTTNVSPPVSKQNLFNIISSAAANAISSHAQQASASPASVTTNTSTASTPAVLTNTNNTSSINTENSNQASISSSQCSSTASSRNSIDSSPLNSQSNQNYLSSFSAASPSPSSLLLIPNQAASLLMLDQEQHQGHQHPLGQHHRQLQLHSHHHHHNQSAPQHQAYGNSHHHLDPSERCSVDEPGPMGALHHQQQHRSPLLGSNIHQHMLAAAATQCNADLVDPKSNLENLLQLANQNGHPQSAPAYESPPSREAPFQQHTDNHLAFVFPQEAANSSPITTSSGSRSAAGGGHLQQPHQHLRAQLTNAAKSKSNGYLVKTLAKSSSNSATSSTTSSTNSGPKVRRCRQITDYVLAEEEKRLLIKEGYADFPMTCQARPLSKSEERILRKIRRKIRNKKSAQCSRQRKKEYVEDLERKYSAVVRENEELKQLVARIQQQQQ